MAILLRQIEKHGESISYLNNYVNERLYNWRYQKQMEIGLPPYIRKGRGD